MTEHPDYVEESHNFHKEEIDNPLTRSVIGSKAYEVKPEQVLPLDDEELKDF